MNHLKETVVVVVVIVIVTVTVVKEKAVDCLQSFTSSFYQTKMIICV